MESIDEIFRVSLNVCLQAWGSKSKLARDTDISLSYLWKILSGSKYGTDDTRRRLAAALGFAGPQYENFLNIGRRQLGLLEARLPDAHSSEVEEWKEKYHAKAEELEKTRSALLQALADAQERITGLEAEQGKAGVGQAIRKKRLVP